MFDPYQQFVHKSRYARYLPEKKRREHWPETVARYFNFIEKHLKEQYNFDLSPYRGELESAVSNLEVMPSMRAMMSAGKALEKDSTAGFNCSYIAVDDIKAFDETMLILMQGCGVGFSVERQYVNQLPEIPDKMFYSDVVITVKDSKEGWAKALRMLISLLYSGEIPSWDLSKLRPAGARLKTFGGRSSGPGPLDDLFKFVVSVFKNAAGRKLTSIEAHDIMTKIASVIVAGGVRRSAMISLSNLSDDRMRYAKSGQWWEQHVHRALANNSAVYNERPDAGIFMEEWLSLYQSKSGERGIFSREAARKHIGLLGRRDPEHDFGCNPCCISGDTLVDVKIDDCAHRMTIKDFAEYVTEHSQSKFEIKAWNFDNNCIEYNLISFAGLTRPNAKLLKITDTKTGKSIKVTPDHRVWTENRGWVEARDLQPNDELKSI